MKICRWRKDGGPLSKSWGFFFIENKSLFSVVLLKFMDGSRDAYHTHAFNAVSWLLWGSLIEEEMDGTVRIYEPSLRPIITPRHRFHKVTSDGTSIAITFRGPWKTKWKEYLPEEKKFITLTHGRKIV